MIYGLSGASGTGKTTLATMVADSMNLAFVRTSISESARRHGFNPVGRMKLDDRIDLQFHLLDDMLKLIDTCDRPAILDRTPVDMIAYMLCEMHMQSHEEISPDRLDRVSEYVDACTAATIMRFDHIFMLSPLPTYEATETRPAVNPGYQLHTHVVMNGSLAMMEGRLNFSIMNTTDLNQRVDYLTTVIEHRINSIEDERASSAHIH